MRKILEEFLKNREEFPDKITEETSDRYPGRNLRKILEGSYWRNG